MDEIGKKLDRLVEGQTQMARENESRYRELLARLVDSQELCAGRYQELKLSIEDMRGGMEKMVTKEEFNRAFESLSQDIHAVIGDHSKLKKRTDLIEKRVTRLEQRG